MASNIQDFSHAPAASGGAASEFLPGHQLSLFSKPVIDDSYSSGYHRVFRADSRADFNGPFTIKIEADPGSYSLLNTMRLCATLRLTRLNGTAVPEAEVVAPIPLPLASMFQSVQVEIGNVSVPDLGRVEHYGTKYYMDSIIGNSQLTKFTWLDECAAAYIDDAGGHDNMDIAEPAMPVAPAAGAALPPIPDDTRNRGFLERYKKFKGSKDVFVNQRLNLPINSIGLAFTDSTDIILTFTKHSPSFYLMRAPTVAGNANNREYTLEIRDLRVTMRRVRIAQSLLETHKREVARLGEMNYPFARCEMRTRGYPAQERVIRWDNIFSGQELPSHLFVTLASTTAFSGNYARSPYKFEDFKSTKCYFTVNEHTIPTEGFKYYIADDGENRNDNIAEIYRHFVDTVGQEEEYRGGTLVTSANFKNGFFLASFLNTFDYGTGILSHTPIAGSMNFVMEFREALQQPVTLIVMALAEDSLLVDRYGGVRVQSHLSKLKDVMGVLSAPG